MRILIIGGTGNISWWCTAEALALGHEVWILNRAETRTTRRQPPPGVREIHADVNDPTSLADLRRLDFDAVANFICFNPHQAQQNIDIFQGRTRLFIFISSEAIYQRRPEYLPFKENTPQYDTDNVCSYIKGKIEAEETFLRANEANGFPVAIVRPGYTYDTIVPVSLGHNCFTAPKRALDGKAFLIGGDGENRWTFTHSRDFARAFCAILENTRAIGDAVHITSDYVYTWNEATHILANALGVSRPRIVHIPAHAVLSSDLGDQREVAESRMFDSVFDTSKIKSLVPEWRAKIPLEEGLHLTVDWLREDPRRIRLVPALDHVLEGLECNYGDK